MNYFFIDRKEKATYSGLVEDSKLREIFIDLEDRSLVGNIIRARVENVVRGMNAAFVDIGEDKNAFLKLEDALARDEIYSKKDHRIEDVIRANDELMVQVLRDPVDGKGAKISCHYEIQGRYIVLTPFSSKVNVSRKIREDIRLRLRYQGREIQEDSLGFIIRTESQEIDFSLIEDEYRKLVAIYRNIEGERNFLPNPKLIYRPLLDYEIYLRDNIDLIDRVLVQTREERDNLIGKLGIPKEKIEVEKDFTIDYDENIGRSLRQLLARRVHLRSGVELVIDQLEALTTVDVNTGSLVGNLSLEETVFEANIEAARELVNQVILRNISGIILVDFINMKPDQRKKVRDFIIEEFKRDPLKVRVFDFTQLGILEITRETKKNSLRELMTEPCPTCKGRGRI